MRAVISRTGSGDAACLASIRTLIRQLHDGVDIESLSLRRPFHVVEPVQDCNGQCHGVKDMHTIVLCSPRCPFAWSTVTQLRKAADDHLRRLGLRVHSEDSSDHLPRNLAESDLLSVASLISRPQRLVAVGRSGVGAKFSRTSAVGLASINSCRYTGEKRVIVGRAHGTEAPVEQAELLVNERKAEALGGEIDCE